MKKSLKTFGKVEFDRSDLTRIIQTHLEREGLKGMRFNYPSEFETVVVHVEGLETFEDEITDKFDGVKKKQTKRVMPSGFKRPLSGLRKHLEDHIFTNTEEEHTLQSIVSSLKFVNENKFRTLTKKKLLPYLRRKDYQEQLHFEEHKPNTFRRIR